MAERQTEFFGPDLGRGPFASQRIETAAVQIATALAQLRVPLARNDDDLRAHVTFIRELADRLAPDWAAQIVIDVGSLKLGSIPTTIQAVTGTYSLLELWLADTVGGGESDEAPTAVSFGVGTLLRTVTENCHYQVLTTATGVVQATVTYGGYHDWYWGICRQGRAYYSSRLRFG